MEWLNRPFQTYGQYTYEIPQKARTILNRYGWFFDNDYFYYRPKKKQDIMIRIPLWMWPQKDFSGKEREKWRRISHEKQVKLCLVVME
jgi:hypothetical protein